MKLLVETNGNYALYDLMARAVIQANRPTVVENTNFIQLQRGTKLTVLEVLGDDASDSELQVAKNAEELKAAIANLPRPAKAEPKTVEPKAEKDPLDHDGDGRKGGSLPKAKRGK